MRVFTPHMIALLIVNISTFGVKSFRVGLIWRTHEGPFLISYSQTNERRLLAENANARLSKTPLYVRLVSVRCASESHRQIEVDR